MLKEKLKELRKEKGITQEELASVIGVERSSVGKYESRNIFPSVDVLTKIAKYFGVSVDYLLDRRPSPDMPKPTRPGSRWIPVLGSVAAGIPIESVEQVLDYEEISAEQASNGDFFALRVQEKSMFPLLTDGDVVIVRRQPDAETGDVVVVLVNGDEATVKKIKKHPKGIMLIPLNQDEFETMFYSAEDVERIPVRILGRVVEVRKKL